MKTMIDLNLTGEAFVDELHANVGSSAFKIDHDWFWGGGDLEIWTSSGGSGTKLVETTDYVLSITDSDLGTRSGKTVYGKIQVTNATYQTGNLYFTGDYIADSIEAADINQAFAWGSVKEYDTDDIASYGGELYKAVADGLNQNPSTQNSYWKIYGNVGDVIFNIHSTKPGYLSCIGDTLCKGDSGGANNGIEYTELIDLLITEAGGDTTHPYYHADSDKAVLPDMQGRIPRGIDASAVVDKDGTRKSGNKQADDNKAHDHGTNTGTQSASHSHTTNIGSHAHDYTGSSASSGIIKRVNNSANRPADITSVVESTTIGNKTSGIQSASHTHTITSAGSTEGTMKNTALYALIKY